MACAHPIGSDLEPPRPNQAVYREDCTQCFDSIRRSKRSNREDPSKKITKLAVVAESDEDRYDITTTVVCYDRTYQGLDDLSESLKRVIDGVMKASTYSRREEVRAWEQEYLPCEHVLCLKQHESNKDPKRLSSCSLCDLKENLWLCLTCGNVGCGRNQLGGLGGNSHGLHHATESGHPVAVKLGSITPEGNADVYCYQCNEERIDTNLAAHLAHWGINISEQEKTEKSLVELQIEQNLKWDFSMTADGQEAEPLYGPGFTGLKNLGNSCYLASTLQCLFSIPAFKARYYHPSAEPPFSQNPAEDLETQLRKIADGLLSGRYSRRPTIIESGKIFAPDGTPGQEQKGLSPSMLKHLVGRGHEEFSTMRQQDAFEFLQHLFKLISLSKHSDGLCDPVESFRFALEQRLQCLDCGKVKYKVDEQDNLSISVPASLAAGATDEQPMYERVTFRDCLDVFTEQEIVEMTCPSCGSKKGFTKRTLFKTFPETLAVNARRFALINWVPTKLDIPVDVDDEPVDMSKYLSPGLQPGEEEITEDHIETEVDSCDPAALQQLLEMGFSEAKCRKALTSTEGPQPDAAMDWLFTHMDEPDPDTSSGTQGQNEDEALQISQLCEMGIDAAVARKSLRETNGDVARAIDWVFNHPDALGTDEEDDPGPEKARSLPGCSETPANFQLTSIICHKGTSVHAGHYVSFIRKELPDSPEPTWILYNDEKVVRATDADEMKKHAYVYFFRRT
ncbi:hypothetical protein KEM54_001072 [Ascosphaera aggregata]|nr:hypothetical protein KEM54_001072 [Ascosphaera aggregata]